MTLDAAALTKAQDLFKGLGLSQAAAQSLVDFHTGQLAAISDAPVKAYNDTVEAWGQALKADPEVGAKLTEVKANLGRAYDVLINAVPEKAAETRALVNEFKSMMDLTGAGNHPAFVKVFNRLALAVIEPGHVSGKAPVSPNATGAVGSGNPGLAASMYPKNAS